MEYDSTESPVSCINVRPRPGTLRLRFRGIDGLDFWLSRRSVARQAVAIFPLQTSDTSGNRPPGSHQEQLGSISSSFLCFSFSAEAQEQTYLLLLLPLIFWISLELRTSSPFLKRPTWPEGVEPEPDDTFFLSLGTREQQNTRFKH